MKKDILKKGDASGNGMVVKFQMPSGLEVISFPTKNPYGGQWDLGPTWNYVVLGDRPFLVDVGRWGQGKSLISMMEGAGFDPENLKFILITHGHEDHDGGLKDVIGVAGLKVKAHVTYDLMRRPYPQLSPGGYKLNFPARCWRCFMPESFYTKNCLGYHEFLRDLAVDTIGDNGASLDSGIRAIHLPGHSPDCLAVLLGKEGIIVGDVVLPDITPWPTSLEMFETVAPVIRQKYTDGERLFGLESYIRSLKKLQAVAKEIPDIAIFPAHRLYYDDKWTCINLSERVEELLVHHVHRCAAILEIVSSGPKTIDEIAVMHFEEAKLKGVGIHLARNEIISHCELMVKYGDLLRLDGKGSYVKTGSSNFERAINATCSRPLSISEF